MNIRKSAIITVFLGCVFATHAYASNKLKEYPFADKCVWFVVHISDRILDKYIVSSNQFVMNRGEFDNCIAINTGINNMDCIFRQGAFYGPDATLLFKRKTDGQIAKIRVQQNFCLMEAGSITVEPIRGKWVYRTQEGSAGSFKHGNVWLDQVSLDN
ncbi:MAG: hypothetical protein LPH21_10195 [Shewanella sp.]|nr:hypothetical protein [Shewanella sp.]MCF1431599.1 hypothetical protein [Shewanella sp.]MCF1457903.1 hypothetical protein [Shewanella sp.]